ncbi:MAG: methyl-accepting chemotaxis sensory transducer [Modestobacter sp.]|nr:methyl-accepting chemotaxis sensory transducer [Modestobacter sp.]
MHRGPHRTDSAANARTGHVRARRIAENEAATGSGDIAANIGCVVTAAHVTPEGVAQSRMAVAELARMSSGLQDIVGRFTY